MGNKKPRQSQATQLLAIVLGSLVVLVPIMCCSALITPLPATPEPPPDPAAVQAAEEAARLERERIQRERDLELSRQIQEKQAREAAIEDAWNALPSGQRRFCEALLVARDAYQNAGNDLQRSAARGDRARAIRSVGRSVQGWEGTIVGLTTNGDGHAIVDVEMPGKCSDFHLKTWNNALSDAAHKTMIPRDSRTFQVYAGFNEGDIIRFSGSFIPDPTNGWAGTSMTEAGSMRAEHFLFRFGR